MDELSRALLGVARDPTFILAPDGKIELASASAGTLLGVDPATLVGRPFDVVVPARIELTRTRVGDREVVVARDVAVANELDYLRHVQRIARLGCWIWEAGTERIRWSDQLYRIYGFEPGAVTPSLQKWLDLLHPDDRARYEAVGARMLYDGKPASNEYRMVRPDGSVRWIASRSEPSVDAQGRYVGLVGIEEDVTERKLAESALRRSETRFKRLVESDIFSIIFGDGSGRLTDANDHFLRTFGYDREDLKKGLRWDTMTPPEWAEVDARVVEDVRTKGGSAPYEKEFLRKDGTRVPILLGIVAHGTNELDVEGIGIVLDLTRQKKAEEAVRRTELALRDAQKMEALGRLAGGIAHDFNNILAAITSYGELALSRPGSDARAPLSEIIKAADRAAALTRQLLTFGRKDLFRAAVPLDLNGIVYDMERLLRRLIGEDVRLEIVPGRELGAVEADRSQVEQVIVNLALNARDAMPRGGDLTIETRNQDGEWVLLAVTDTGCGMDVATRERIFEPFFTTKPEGRGTGLGLATVYGVVQRSGGRISVHSEPGRGARFEILLPRTHIAAEAPVVPYATPSRGSETVLLVEDDGAVRAVTRALLEQSGYAVLDADRPSLALEISASHAGPIHLLLTDVILPEMNGPRLHAQIAARRPSIRAVYMSGHTYGVLERQGGLPAGTAFLQKPFTLAGLTAELRAVLDAPASASR